MMYTLQRRPMAPRKQDDGWTDEQKRGSVSELKDYARHQNTDYRIIDSAGVVLWSFYAIMTEAAQ